MSNTTAIQTQNSAPDAATIETVLVGGDLSKLTPAQRVSYYNAVCDSLGLNPLTKPFDYIVLNGKMTLYARRDAADQLRANGRVSVVITSREIVDGVMVVSARATMPDGRTDESIGAVNIQGLKGDALANAMMKAETKAKRRVTLSICGLGMTDETEVETIPGANRVVVTDDGEVIDVTGKTMSQTGLMHPTETMTLETALAFKNGHGVGYGDLDNETLEKIAAHNEAPQDRRDAAKIILADRAKG